MTIFPTTFYDPGQKGHFPENFLRPWPKRPFSKNSSKTLAKKAVFPKTFYYCGQKAIFPKLFRPGKGSSVFPIFLRPLQKKGHFPQNLSSLEKGSSVFPNFPSFLKIIQTLLLKKGSWPNQLHQTEAKDWGVKSAQTSTIQKMAPTASSFKTAMCLKPSAATEHFLLQRPSSEFSGHQQGNAVSLRRVCSTSSFLQPTLTSLLGVQVT